MKPEAKDQVKSVAVRSLRVLNNLSHDLGDQGPEKNKTKT